MFVREIMEASKDELDVVQSSQEPQSRVGGELHSIKCHVLGVGG